MKKLLTLLVVAAFTLAAYPAMANVSGSPHDFAGKTGTDKTDAGAVTGVRGLCETCHVPHAASATTAKRLWRTKLAMVSDTGPWGTSVVGELCGTCHYSPLALINYPNASNQSPHVVDSVYDSASHGRTVAILTNARSAGGIGDKIDDTGRPYMSQTYMQCTSCHNPHDDITVRPFLRAIGTQDTISKVCGGCHDRYNTAVGTNNKGPVNSDTGATLTNTNSMHPVDVTFADIAGNNTDTTNGMTQFHQPSAALTNVVGINNWTLGGKFQDSAGKPLTAAYVSNLGLNSNSNGYEIGCQTCHSIHAPATTADGSKGVYLLAIDNSPSSSNAGAALCEDCHGGGYNGQTNGQYVGALTTKLTSSNQTLRDHPIDQVCDGTPKLEAWGTTTRYERAPYSGAPTAWPFANSTTGYQPSNTANLAGQHIGRVVCTSCHSAHNAKNGTSLNRSGGNAATFCFSCHFSQDMVPGNHHSTVFSGISPVGPIVGGNWASSKIQCSNCHASVDTPTAHMGFFNLNVGTADGNASSELCNSCHVGGTSDPVYQVVNGYTATIPNGHLSDLGDGVDAKSHYLGVIKGTPANSINVKIGYWKLAVNNGRPGSSYSKYGGNGVDTHNNTPPTATVGTSTMICESCHSVLYNCGDGSLAGGYNVNLLLQNYEDNQQGTTTGATSGISVNDGAPGSSTNVGSGLCVACHNQGVNANGMGTSNGFVAHSVVNGPAGSGITPANMHPMTGWTITKAVDAGRTPTTLITGAGSYADQGTAPGAGSYDGTDKLSCDGCHRPHRAAKYGTWKGVSYDAGSISVILESAGPTNGDYGTLCQQCHNM